MTDTTSTKTVSDATPKRIDPFFYILNVSVQAQENDQWGMQLLSETLEYLGQAGTDATSAGTKILENDNTTIQNAKTADGGVQKAQAQEQVDNTRINNTNEQFSNLNQTTEAGVNAWNTSDQNETEFIKSVLPVYDNVNNLIVGMGSM